MVLAISGHHHGGCATDDFFAIDCTPITGIETVVAMSPIMK